MEIQKMKSNYGSGPRTAYVGVITQSGSANIYITPGNV